MMSVVLLLSTFGVTVNKHYCRGRLSGMKLYVMATCGNCDEDEAMEMGCCKHEQKVYQFDEDFSVAPVHTVSLEVATLISILIGHPSFDLLYVADHASYLHYRPPIPDRDIPVLIQSFLI